MLQKRRIPCVLLTGFLGSGKTTLLNRILSRTTLKLMVLENEVGEASVDDELLESKAALTEGTEVVLMPNGCMCCRVRGDLVQAFKDIAGRVAIEGVVLELSGLSALAPVMQTFFSDPYVQSRLVIDSVVCVVDATQGRRLRLEEDEEDATARLMQEQLSLSDNVYINKIDLLKSPEDDVKLAEAIRKVNTTAKVYSGDLRDESVEIPFVDTLFQHSMFALKNIERLILDLEKEEQEEKGEEREQGHGHHKHEHEHEHGHDEVGYTTRSFVRRDAPLDFYKFQLWLEENVLKPFPDKLVRYKGIIWSKIAGEDHRIVMQGVYGHVEMSRPASSGSSAVDKTKKNKKEQHKTVLVFIGQLDDESKLGDLLMQGVEKCMQNI